ncbi:MAG: cyclase family protein [Candidatus Dormibacterales bacterium]
MPEPAKSLDSLVAALSAARVYDLEQPRVIGMPAFPAHWPGYHFALGRRHEAGLERRTSASGMTYCAEHSGTHIDAFCHQAEEMAMFGGVAVTAAVQTQAGFKSLGVETIEPILRRGVLLDLAPGGPLPAGTLVGVADLERAAARQGTQVRPGDVLLVRLGWGARWADAALYLEAPGMDREAAEWAAGRGVFAVGADNMAWDLPGYVDPVLGSSLPCHVVLLVRHGVHMIENLMLEELAAAGVTEFLFACVPLKYVGGTASAVRPLALAP